MAIKSSVTCPPCGRMFEVYLVNPSESKTVVVGVHYRQGRRWSRGDPGYRTHVAGSVTPVLGGVTQPGSNFFVGGGVRFTYL